MVDNRKTLFGAHTLGPSGNLDEDVGERKSEGVFLTISGQGYFGYCSVRLQGRYPQLYVSHGQKKCLFHSSQTFSLIHRKLERMEFIALCAFEK